jgi:hypothetical protein
MQALSAGYPASRRPCRIRRKKTDRTLAYLSGQSIFIIVCDYV